MAKNKNTIDLPEVKDIPGQENVRPPKLGELSDTTASSADEEGDDVLEPGDDDDFTTGNESDVTADERRTLARVDVDRADSEDEVLKEGALDDTDDDGDPLNEDDDYDGEDLDVPGSEDDDPDEELGEEDEENNDYSLSDDDDHEEREDI